MAAAAGTAGTSTKPIATDSGLYLLQLVAFAAMLLDHINWFLFAHGGNPQSTDTAWMNNVGRIALPLFAFTFGVNLDRVRKSADHGERMRRMVRRLSLAALAAQIPYWLLRGYALPTNVLATFWVSAVTMLLWHRGQSRSQLLTKCLAVALAVVAGALVEYWWAGIGLICAANCAARGLTRRVFIALALSVAALCALNQNLFALLAIPLVLLLRQCDLPVHRRSGWLYVAYPAHLIVLLGLSSLT